MSTNVSTASSLTLLLGAKFDRLCYWRSDQWQPLPEWANFYLEVGALLNMPFHDGRLSVTIMVVPTRAYVSPLIACGLLLARNIDDTDKNNSEHLRNILSLAPHTPVIWRNGNRKLNAYYLGQKTYEGKSFIWLKVEKGTERGVHIEDVWQIEVSERDRASLPKQQKGRAIQPASPLLKALLDQGAADDYALVTRHECLLIGLRTMLESEVLNAKFAYVINPQQPAAGILQDILRVHEFLPDSEAHRTRLVTAHSSAEPDFGGKLPRYAIFDGALGFIKLRESLRGLHWVIILDRTDRNLDIAVEQINQEYATRRIDPLEKYQGPTPPSGVELMIYDVGL